MLLNIKDNVLCQSKIMFGLKFDPGVYVDVNKQNSLTGSVFSAKLGLDWDQPSPIAGFSKKNHTLGISQKFNFLEVF